MFAIGAPSSSVGGAHAFSHVFLGLNNVVEAHRGHEGLFLHRSFEEVHQLGARHEEAPVFVRRLVECLVLVVGHWRWTVVSLQLLKALLLSRDDLPDGGARFVGLEARRLVVGWCRIPLILCLVHKADSLLLELLGPKRLDLEFLMILSGRRVLVPLLFLSKSCDARKLVDGESLAEDH